MNVKKHIIVCVEIHADMKIQKYFAKNVGIKMTDDLDKQIQELEDKWNLYHKDHKNNPCPDMIELTKLRIRKKQLEKK